MKRATTMARIKLADWPTPIEVGRGTILETALAAGIPFPHGCMSGECGTCKCRLAAGAVSHDGYSPDALSESERRDGIILACRARPRGDIELEWATPRRTAVQLPVRRVRARVVHKSAAARDVIRLRLEVVAGPLAFAAGQFARLEVGTLPPRSYSMANRPGAALLEFHIRRVIGGAVSSYIAEELRVGDQVKLEGPFGSAYWDTPRPGPLLLIAGGTGLAPLKSVLTEALDAGQAPIHVYHGVRDEQDLYDSEELSRLAAQKHIRYTAVLSAPMAATARRTGMVHSAVAGDFTNLAGFRVFTAGPPPMVEATRALALTLGAAPNDIVADAFHHAPPERAGLFGRLRSWIGTQIPGIAVTSQ
jgi:ferredoxin-NAD(P)+ reductase (naphthalene dioxygenase ferredoxin-specific)